MEKQNQPYVISLTQDQYVISTQPTVQTVVTEQPMSIVANQAERDWSTGTCGFCEDCRSCALGLFCPYCYLCCCVSEKMGEHCCAPVIVPDIIMVYRMKLRTRYNIKGSVICDCCCSYWCSLCTLCQIAREIKYIESQIKGPAFPKK